MTMPANTPKWLFHSETDIPATKRSPSKKRPRGRTRQYTPKDVSHIEVTRRLPEEAEAVLELHAKTLARELGRDAVSNDLAQDDLNYRNRIFRSYLPHARRQLKQRESVKDQHEFQQQESKDTGTAVY